ncbi:cytochrome c [Desulfobacula sp.]|uniref:c-type cytochrome n=1 Tax=Desulfobacula sp. TaxID=2593537 RepID=UPI002623024E|nr:cytochrome c [Desulfobacula sp.]
MKKVLFLAVFVSLVLTGAYTVITLYDSNLKAGRMYQTPVIRPHEEPQLVMDKRTIADTKSEALIRANLKTDFTFAPTLSAQVMLVKGEKDYRAFCFHCHGPNLDGLGTVGQSFFPLPTNLTNKRTAGMSDAELFAFISYGGKKAPALASSMSVESREAVIQYIRSKQKTTL